MPPAAAARAEAAKKAKEAKQKKLLIALAPVLLILLAWQGPKTVGAVTGGDEAAPSPASTTPTTPTTADPTGAPPSTAEGATPATTTGSAILPDTDVPLPPGADQLASFDRFVGKDPFRGLVVRAAAGSPSTTTTGSGGGSFTGGGGSTSGGGSAGGGGSTRDAANPTGATIDVNGSSAAIAVGGSFPSDDPTFRLVSLTRTTASIGLVAGTFSDGRKRQRVRVGASLTLVSQPDGVRYTITIVSIA